jgi:hypothetical protein
MEPKTSVKEFNAFLEQSDELTLAEYRSSTTPTHAEKIA